MWGQGQLPPGSVPMWGPGMPGGSQYIAVFHFLLILWYWSTSKETETQWSIQKSSRWATRLVTSELDLNFAWKYHASWASGYLFLVYWIKGFVGMIIKFKTWYFPGIPGMPGAMPGQPMQPFHPMVGAWPGQAVRKIQNIQIWNHDGNKALLSLTSTRVWAWCLAGRSHLQVEMRL